MVIPVKIVLKLLEKLFKSYVVFLMFLISSKFKAFPFSNNLLLAKLTQDQLNKGHSTCR